MTIWYVYLLTSKSGYSACTCLSPASDASIHKSLMFLTAPRNGKSEIKENHTQNNYIPSMPQSVTMASAALAVPPVAISGSRRKTWSIGGEGGSFE